MKIHTSTANLDWYQGKTAWRFGLPYLTPGSVERLNRELKTDWDVLEFGSGGSTIWFATHCHSVQSFETSPEWEAKVAYQLRQRRLTNVTLRSLSSLSNFKPEPDSFDLILVDSDGAKTNRLGISILVLPWLKRSGVFVLDNYDRYKLDFLDETIWEIDLYQEDHWDGKGTLIAKRK